MFRFLFLLFFCKSGYSLILMFKLPQLNWIYDRGNNLSNLNEFHKINNKKLKQKFMNIQRIRDQQLDIVDPLKSIKLIFLVVLISQLYMFPFQMSK